MRNRSGIDISFTGSNLAIHTMIATWAQYRNNHLQNSEDVKLLTIKLSNIYNYDNLSENYKITKIKVN